MVNIGCIEMLLKNTTFLGGAAMAYEIVWEREGVLKRFWGELTSQDLLEATKVVVESARFDSILYVINDFTEVEKAKNITLSVIEDYAAQRIGAAMVNPRMFSPFIATKEPGLSIAYALIGKRLANRHKTKCFSTLVEARQWMGENLPL